MLLLLLFLRCLLAIVSIDGNHHNDDKECPKPVPNEHSVITNSTSKFRPGDTIGFTCDTGYRLTGKRFLLCLRDGRWEADPPTCTARSCPNPGVLSHGYYTVKNSSSCHAHTLDQLHYKCNVIVNCNRGYTLNNCHEKTAKRECLASGDWSHTYCNCEKITCQYPGDIKNDFYRFQNGSHYATGAIDYESLIEAECEPGYGLSQVSHNRKCQYDGTWSGNGPVCRLLTCTHPGSFQYGNYTFTNGSIYSAGIVNYGVKVLVTCSKGYELFGNGTRTCISNKNWSGGKPVCSIIQCNYPGHFSNGLYTFQNGTDYNLNALDYRSVVFVKCNTGYENLGDERRTCTINKTWSCSNPVCIKINCSHPGNFPNGIYTLADGSKFTSNATQYGAKLFVKCNEGYENKGQIYRTCSSDKTWAGKPPVCNIVKCKHPGHEVVVNGHYRQANGEAFMNAELNYSSTIEVHCTLGFELLSGSMYRTCLKDGNWSGQGAKCTKVKCLIPNATDGIIYNPSSVGELFFSDTLNVSCEEGFVFKGSEVRRCVEDGNLDGDIAVCERVQYSSQSAVVGGTTCVGIVIFAVLIIVAVLIYRRRHLQAKQKQHNAEIPTKMQQQNGTGDYSEIQETGCFRTENTLATGAGSDGIYTNNPTEESEQFYYSFDGATVIPKTAIMVKDLPDLVWAGKAATEKFRREYECLPEGLKEKHFQATKLQNRSKNKYKNVYAYDQTRVILEKDITHDSDYINACYIHGFNKVRAYIASQGPITATLDDFWRMIWQTKCSKIVMLTNLSEDGKRKCEQYWPDKGNITYGDITVILKKTEIFSEFVIRNLMMQKGKNGYENVTHFHFTAWPDKGVPKYASSLVKFRNKVKQAPCYGKGPTVIHCSAGVGRTGTFIALDILTDQANVLNYVDVAGTVETLRKQRLNMVQTLEQYIFVHHALVETLMLSSSAMPAAMFPGAYKNLLIKDEKGQKRKIDVEFEMMAKLSPSPKDSQYVSAKLFKNREKNRFSNIIPVDDFMPSLISDDGKHTDYVNAVYLPSYKEKNAFIITQTPIESTREDFWRLVLEHNVHTIVMLNNRVEMLETEIYWPKKGETVNFGAIEIVNDGAEKLSDHQVNSLTVRKNQMIRYIKQFQFGGWRSNKSLPDSPEVILSLMELVQCWQQQTQNHTILVHCMNGVDKSGLYCVISAVIERMKIEQDVAISQVIEEMRNARDEIISSVEQYQYCHEAVLSFMEQYETYSNFTPPDALSNSCYVPDNIY